MLPCGRSKDRESRSHPPGPVYMSNNEFAEFLKNLRNSRVERPRGARPLSTNTRSEYISKDNLNSMRESFQANSFSTTPNVIQRPNSAFSHRRAQSSLSTTYSSSRSRTGCHTPQLNYQNPQFPLLKPSEVVPTATYIERGHRWMEKEEAVALREAMEDMDVSEDARIYAAAQKEASELVWQHKNPDLVEKPDQPYRYKNHLRKNSYQHARSESASRYSGASQATGSARDMSSTLRSASGGSNSSEGLTARSRRSTNASDFIGNYYNHQDLKTDGKSQILAKQIKDDELRSMRGTRRDASKGSIGSAASKRRNSCRRNISGELITGPFKGDQIWEEPEHDSIERGRSQMAQDMPEPLRAKTRNPINRVQFVQDVQLRPNSTPPESNNRKSIFEIHKNPPSQSRNPRYVANHPPKTYLDNDPSEARISQAQDREVLEIRSDEIRQATSMRLKDRSLKLPIPSMVSDKPGRPIVSFDPRWKPKKADLKPESRKSPNDYDKLRQSLPHASAQTSSLASPPIQFSIGKSTTEMNYPKVTTESFKKNASNSNKPSPSSKVSYQIPSTPSIVHSELPSVSVTSPSLPVINIEKSDSKPKRPLPIPTPRSSTNIATASNAATSQSHWTRAISTRATVKCHLCQLPIQNRVLKVGTNEHFHPECFSCFACETGLESLEIFPEPSSVRAERINRIRRRAKGEHVPEIEGQTQFDDGDEKNRYYCHLDFHEKFAPKCKQCKTPIIGEHIVALGAHWHYGHFFCAECGNPFEKDMTHIYKDGYAWCLNCQTKRTERQAPKCRKCRKAVIGEYVRALGGEWHDQCFRCDVCQKEFDDGSFYPKQVNAEETIVLCIRCIERELKA